MSDRTGVQTDERGDAMQARSGAAYYPMEPRPEDVRLGDVLWALSRMPRFGGHAARGYTVLEHEIRGCDLALAKACLAVDADGDPDDRGLHWISGPHGGKRIFIDPSLPTPPAALRIVCDVALAFLVHDAAEAYIADMTRPLKVNLPDYVAAERRNDAAVRAALLPRRLRDLGPPLARDVKDIDNLMLSAERVALMVPEEAGGLKWGDLPAPPTIVFHTPAWSDADRNSCIDEACDLRECISTLVGIGMSVPLDSRTNRSRPVVSDLQEVLRAAAHLDAALLCAAWLRRYRVLWTLCADPDESCPAVGVEEML